MSKDIDPGHMTKDDVQYVQDRPTLRQEFILQGYGDPLAENYPGLVDEDGEYLDGKGPTSDSDSSSPEPYPDELPDGGETNVQSHLPEDQQWVEENKKAELEAVIDARNADRDDDSKITVSGDKKDDLLDALRADDLAIAEWIAAHPDE